MTSRAVDWVRALVRVEKVGELPAAEAETAGRIVHVLFDLVIPRWFTPETPVRDITAQMLAVRTTVGAKVAQPVVVLEMVVRHALGEPVPVDDLDPYVLVQAKAAIVSQYAHSVGLLDDELDALLAAAEQAV